VGLPCLPASVRVESSCWAGESSLGPSTTRTGRRRSRACSSTGTCAASTSGSPGTPGHRGPPFAPQARQARSDPTRSRARASAVAQSRATVPVVLPRCVPIPVPQAADRLGSRTTRRSTRQPPASSTRRSSPGADHHAGPQPREQRPGGRLRSHLKRDHVGGAELRAAESVLLQLVGWIADYNTQAPPRRPGTPAPGGVPGDSTQRAPICLTKWGTDHATSQPRRNGCSIRRRPRGRRDVPLDLVRPCTRLP
jgi:hypothetical protein